MAVTLEVLAPERDIVSPIVWGRVRVGRCRSVCPLSAIGSRPLGRASACKTKLGTRQVQTPRLVQKAWGRPKRHHRPQVHSHTSTLSPFFASHHRPCATLGDTCKRVTLECSARSMYAGTQRPHGRPLAAATDGRLAFQYSPYLYKASHVKRRRMYLSITRRDTALLWIA